MGTEPAMTGVHAPTAEEVIRQRLSTALGGWRGSLEAALPTVAFVLLWSLRQDLTAAIVAAVAITIVLGGLRLLQRQTIRFVANSLLATGIAAFFALRSGRAEDAFLPGIIGSGVWGTVALLSVVTRWPFIGFLVGAADPLATEDPFAWRRDRALVRVCQRLTLVLVALFALRVAIMLPLYFASQIELLGVAKIVLGWPAYLLAIAIMGWLLVRGETEEAANAPAAREVTEAPADGVIDPSA